MRPINCGQESGNKYCAGSYADKSLHDLLSLIANEGDRRALNEFHIRPLFRFKGDSGLTCSEYIDRCRIEVLNFGRGSIHALETSDGAYDLSIRKFSNLIPKKQLNELSNTKDNLKQDGINCCYYFKAIENQVMDSFKSFPYKNQLELELRAVAAVQGFVRRHFHLSVLEVRRKINPLWSRYYWDIDGNKICLSLPVYLKGRERREWLVKNINNPDFRKSGERQRIQDYIYRQFENFRFISFNEAIHGKNTNTFESSICRNLDKRRSLGEIVAKEKADNIERQRRSIRVLGKDTLKKMIEYIFQNIIYDDYKDREIAHSYGVSKATFSRFAGSHWKNSNSNIPDLWLNTAKVLSVHPVFKDVASETGVWERVSKTIEKGGENK